MDTEQQVRLNFLEEVQDYFNQIESVVLRLTTMELSLQDLDAAMRAAHSVKGGSAMMGFIPLSQIAHRMEDFLKILRVRQDPGQMNIEVETLLLKGVDALRVVSQLHRQGTAIEDQWLTSRIHPIFEQLHDRLGDLRDEDENALLAQEEAVDVSTILFNSGVEDCLDFFETQLNQLHPAQLLQELNSTADQLADFGRMSELDAFVSLCESIQSHAAHLATAQIQPFAQLALEAWRRSHALVAIGQKTQLPSQLTLPETWNLLGEATLEAQDPVLGEATLEEHRSPVEPFMDSLDLFPDSPPSLGDLESNLFDFDTLSDLDLAEIAAMEDLQGVIGDFNFEEAAQDAKSLIPEPSLEETWNCDATEIAEGGSQTITAGESQTIASETAEEIWINDQPETDKTDSVAEPSVQDSDPVFDPLTSIPAPTLSPKETAGTTVRVPMEQLQKINALFGQLIVERNAINLRLSQLQNFVTLMTQRMNQLERSNHQLRQWYDQSAVMEIRNFSFGDATRTEFGIRKQEQGIWQEEVQGSIGQGEQLSPQMIQISRQQAANTALASIPNSELRTPNSELRTPNSFQFDTLELDRYTDLHVLSQDQMETIVQLQEVAADIGLSLREMEEATGDLNYTTRSLQSSITRTQMRPFSDIVSRFPRVVRDLSLQYNKQVQLKLEGETTLIDRLTLENLTDPLNHLLRNAFAHGIEDLETRQALGKPPLGTITLRATHRGNQTIITMQDDGQGISLDKIRDRLGKLGMAQTEIESLRDRELLDLIFEPGFSTAEQLTELSGRGVGMDVVRTNLQQIRGDIRIDTKPNQGTTFTLRVP